MNFYRSVLRPLLFCLDAERAHHLAIQGLKLGLIPFPAPRFDPVLRTNLMGLDFPTPIGLAAGFDKNAEVFEALLKLGFGFVETGTVTPQAQPGNDKPRMFRLIEDNGVINRLDGPFNKVLHACWNTRVNTARRPKENTNENQTQDD